MRPMLLVIPFALAIPAATVAGPRSDADEWNETDYRGAVIDGMGDVNGDGFPEIAVGSHTERRVWVYSCKKGKLLYTLREKKGDFGWSVSGAGDTNQDGNADLVVGSPATDTVRIYKGRKGKLQATIEGDEGSLFGWDVSAAGDTNGNGFSEVVVAARGKGDVPGSARVYVGRTGELLLDLTEGLAGRREVYSVAGTGDVNQDGFADIAVGLPFEGKGTVRVHSGHDGKLLETFTGTDPAHGFGMAVASAGDVDADGFWDLVVGAPYGGDGAGTAIVYSVKSGEELFRVNGADLGERLGFSVSSAGDQDLDGRTDVVVGAPGRPRELSAGPIAKLLEQFASDAVERLATRGRSIVFSGRGGSVLQEIKAVDEGDWFGVAVSGVGDADGDGRSDFATVRETFDKKGKLVVEASVHSGKGGEVFHRFAAGKRLK